MGVQKKGTTYMKKKLKKIAIWILELEDDEKDLLVELVDAKKDATGDGNDVLNRLRAKLVVV